MTSSTPTPRPGTDTPTGTDPAARTSGPATRTSPSAKPAIRAGVILDVDGTLVDSNYHHVLAWSRAFATFDVNLPTAEVHRLLGRSSDDLVEALLGEPSSDVVEAHSSEYESLRQEVRSQPGARDLLCRIHDSGLAVVLASSAESDDHEHNMKVLDANDLVTGSVTAADVPHAKPAPDLFRAALENGDLDVDAAVAVGDSTWDMEAAIRAGLPAIGLTCGGIADPLLRDAGATEVYRDPAELLRHFDGSLLAELSPLGTPANT